MSGTAASDVVPGISPPWISPRRSPASAVPPRSAAVPGSDSPAALPGADPVRPWQSWGGRACPAGSGAASEHEIVAFIRQSPYVAGRTPRRLASQAIGARARPRRGDPWDGGAGEQRSACRRRADAVRQGFPGTATRVSATARQAQRANSIGGLVELLITVEHQDVQKGSDPA